MNVLNVVPMIISSFPPPASVPHVSVLLDEVIHGVDPKPNGIYIDATLGAGGHSEGLLAAGAGQLIGFDRDDVAIELAEARLARFEGRVQFCQASFGDMRAELDRLGIGKVDGIVADLGVSSMQLDEAERGMSFRRSGPLDMRMDRRSGETALELIERVDDDELVTIISKLGEERRARSVVRSIRKAQNADQLRTTRDLRRAVVRAVGPSRSGNIDPATRTFQALRIAVNDELRQIASLIQDAPACLVAGGTLAIISFHSLEDRIAKRMFRDDSIWERMNNKPIVASQDEQFSNNRSRSAKLRVARLRPQAGSLR